MPAADYGQGDAAATFKRLFDRPRRPGPKPYDFGSEFHHTTTTTMDDHRTHTTANSVGEKRRQDNGQAAGGKKSRMWEQY